VDPNGKTSAYYVRCVAGGNGSAPSFTDNNDGTVTDRKSNLIWQKCSMGQNNDAACTGSATTATWANAMTYCNGLTLAGKIWRLPSVNELESIVDESKSNLTIDTVSFPATVAVNYWSSSTHVPYSTSNAWYVTFNFAFDMYASKASIAYVRCATGP
jgi:hypothetical protein